MKYRILKRVTEEHTQFRAQVRRWFLFIPIWDDTDYVDHGFSYSSDLQPRTYMTRDHARDAIGKHARGRVQIQEPDTGWVTDAPP